MTLTITPNIRRIALLTATTIAALLMLAECPEPTSGPGGGWKKVSQSESVTYWPETH